MTVKTWTLTDLEQGIYLDQLSVTPQDVGGAAAEFRIDKHTRRGGLADGVDVVCLNNGRLRVAILPTRGMGIWKAWLDGVEIGWQSPVRGPVHPSFVPLVEPGGLGWLDGFDELLVRCGLESNGAPDFDEQGRLLYPLHGRIANRPAHRVQVHVDSDRGEISVSGVVEETRFHFLKLRMTSTIRLKLGATALEVRDEVENFSGSNAEMQLLYHVNFGQPLLEPGSRFIAPVQQVVPRDPRAAEGIDQWDRYADELAGYSEEVYLLDLLADHQDNTRTLLRNAGSTQGVSLVFNHKQLPCFTLWKNTTTAADGYVTGLEPGTNYPNPRRFEGSQGRAVRLAAGATASFDLGLEIHSDAASVSAAEQEIRELQAVVDPEIFREPQPNWCAG